MDDEHIMNYAFNKDTKYFQNIQKMCKSQSLYDTRFTTSCNYPNIVYQQNEQEFLKSIVLNSVETSRSQTKQTKQLVEMLEFKNFLPISEKELQIVEKNAMKLSRSNACKISSPTICTPIRRKTTRLELLSSVIIKSMK